MGDKTWRTDAISNDWTNGENWQGGSPPEDHDDIVIPEFDVQTTPTPIATAFTAGKLTIQGGELSGGPLTVASEFSWTRGVLDAHVVLQSTGSIEIDSTTVLTGTIENAGNLTLSGTGTIPVANGAEIINTGNFTIEPGVTFDHGGGGTPGIINRGGSLTFSGATSTADPQVIFQDGACYLRLESGTTTFNSAVMFQNGGNLQCAGGNLDGAGRVIVGPFGTIVCSKPATVAKDLTVECVGGDIEGGDVSQLPIRFNIAGLLLLTGMTSINGRIHILAGGRVTAPPGNTALIGGRFVIEGALAVGEPTTFNFNGDGEMMVLGRLELTSTVRFENGLVTNIGVVIVRSPAAVVLDQCSFVTMDSSLPRIGNQGPWPIDASATRRGSLEVRGGTVAISPDVQLTSGTAHILTANAGGPPSLQSPDGWGLRLDAAATLRVIDAVGTALTCAGRIEVLSDSTGSLTAPSIALVPSSRVEAPSSIWTSGKPVLVAANRIDIRGTFAAPAPANLPITQTIVAASDVAMMFDRFDFPKSLAVTKTAAMESATVTVDALQGVAGFDVANWPDDFEVSPPSGLTKTKRGAWLMQQLYEVTDLAFVGFYLAPTGHGHEDTSWMTKLSTLQAQGWGVAPVFMGTGGDTTYKKRVNGVTTKVQVTPSDLTPANAVIDAKLAHDLAVSAGIPAGSRIFFDIETPQKGALVSQSQRLAFVSQWADELTSLGYVPGIYAHDDVVKTFRVQKPEIPVWLVFFLKTPPPILDQNGALLSTTIAAHSNIQPPPDLVQYIEDWKSENWYVLDTSGVTRSPSANRGFDFDVAVTVDPSDKSATNDKEYRTVKEMSPLGGPWSPGERTVTIVLDHAAPPPLGQLVYLSTSSSAAQAAAFVTVPAGETTLDVKIDVHVILANEDITISGWTPHQTLASAAIGAVTIQANSP